MIKLEQGERIYLIKRRHSIVFEIKIAPLLLIFSINFLLFLFVLFFYFPSWPKILSDLWPKIFRFNLHYLILFFLSVFLLLFWSLLWLVIIDYYLNCFIVTNQRIIQIKFQGIFNINYSSIFLDKIQDIVISVKGFLPAFFHFGDIQIETAGGFQQFIFSQIADPEIVKQVILEAQRDYLNLKN